MNRDKETIYEYLTKRVHDPFIGRLNAEELALLDGVLWTVADALCDENAPSATEPERR